MDGIKSSFTKRRDYSFGRLICLELLGFGFPRAFTELFEIIKFKCFPEKEDFVKTSEYVCEMIENRKSELKVIAYHLALFESSVMFESDEGEFEMRIALGNLFQADDKLFCLTEYFYNSCYAIAFRLKDIDYGQRVRAMEKMSFLQEKRGDLDDALNILNNTVSLAEEKGIEVSDKLKKSINLVTYKIFMNMAMNQENKRTEGSADDAIGFYNKAVEMARAAESKECLAEAYVRLGEMTIRVGNFSASLKSYKHFVDLSIELGDITGACYGYIAVALSYKELRKIKSAEKALNHCEEMAAKNNLVEPFIASLIFRGQLYIIIGRVNKARMVFEKASAFARKNKIRFSGYTKMRKFLRVLTGMAKAHFHFKNYTQFFDKNTNYGWGELVRWKRRISNLYFSDFISVTEVTDSPAASISDVDEVIDSSATEISEGVRSAFSHITDITDVIEASDSNKDDNDTNKNMVPPPSIDATEVTVGSCIADLKDVVSITDSLLDETSSLSCTIS